MEKISCSNILQKLRTFEDRQNFARELGIYYYIIFRLYTTMQERLRCKIFFKLFAGREKGKN